MAQSGIISEFEIKETVNTALYNERFFKKNSLAFLRSNVFSVQLCVFKWFDKTGNSNICSISSEIEQYFNGTRMEKFL